MTRIAEEMINAAAQSVERSAPLRPDQVCFELGSTAFQWSDRTAMSDHANQEPLSTTVLD